ncbi:hypothetical protein [Streptosporangium sp. CA-115845]|uniref:hypothetical protein n=1 Tax=Streptosporangium sp. CA-115845 TaxID=3240071 RepID=UPI003D94F0C3
MPVTSVGRHDRSGGDDANPQSDRGVDLAVEAEEIVGFLGPNGEGNAVTALERGPVPSGMSTRPVTSMSTGGTTGSAGRTVVSAWASRAFRI